jgi:glycosyltransferase involved in cell wall biosynthesis
MAPAGSKARIAYVVTMFPCWSETFVLNEIVDHTRAGLDVRIFSLKACSEGIAHDASRPFVRKTTYAAGPFHLGLVLLHAGLFLSRPVRYASLLWKLGKSRPLCSVLKVKSLVVFWLSPPFVRCVKRERIEHIHAHFATYPALLARILSDFTDVPYSFTAHAHDIYVDRTLLPLVAERAKTIVTISRFNKRLMESWLDPAGARRIEVVRCGVDVAEFVPRELAGGSRDHEALRILSVGRLAGIKGYPYLLRALGELRKGGTSFTCRIVGDGPDRGSLEALARQLGVHDCLTFLGARTTAEVRREMEDADLFVLACARDELEGHDGIPVVFMEAMALGTPVIGTRLSGIPELIRHGESGLLAECESPGSLRDVIQYAAEHRAELNLMAVRARRLVVEEFNIAVTGPLLRSAMLT